MYYSIYCNERLVLENLGQYKIPNRLLKRLLFKDDSTDIDEKLEIYFENRNEVGEESPVRHPALDDRLTHDFESGIVMTVAESFAKYKRKRDMQIDFFEDDDTCEFEGGYYNPHCCYVDCEINPYFEQFIDVEPESLEWKLDENRREEFERGISRAESAGWKLREVDEVHLYKSDLQRIEEVRKKHKLNELESQVLFGLIFMTRLYGYDCCRLNTETRIKGFKACFDRHVSDEVISKVAKLGLFRKIRDGRDWNTDKDKYDWKYLHWNEDEEIAFTFKVTVENNELNLSDVFKLAIPKQKYCAECGIGFVPKGNRAKYCPECKAEIAKEQHRQAQQRYKERKGL